VSWWQCTEPGGWILRLTFGNELPAAYRGSQSPNTSPRWGEVAEVNAVHEAGEGRFRKTKEKTPHPEPLRCKGSDLSPTGRGGAWLGFPPGDLASTSVWLPNAGGDLVDPKPFVHLAKPRPVELPALPADLVAFYTANEGVGLERSPDRLVSFCCLDEVRRIGWQDLHNFGADESAGWENFAAYRLGVSSFFDEIVYVLDAPSCPAGSILTLGGDVSGPGGSGPAVFEASLVLASSFAEWLGHLEECGWTEYGLVPGALRELSEAEERKHRDYYKALNPGINW
jgi:hypothetical protein